MSAPQNIQAQNIQGQTTQQIAPGAQHTTIQREYVQGNVMQNIKNAVVNETVKQHHLEEVQPIIHREREQTEVRQIQQPLLEREVAPTQVQHVETREVHDVVREAPRAEYQNRDVNLPHSTRTVQDSGVAQKVLAPIVQETVVKHVVEEIQPVVHREVVQNEVIHHTHHVFEKVQEAPVLVQQTREPVFLAQQAAPAPIIQQAPIQREIIQPVVAQPQHVVIEIQQEKPHHHHHHHHKHHEPSHIIHPISSTQTEVSHATSAPVAYKKEDKLEKKDLINSHNNTHHTTNTTAPTTSSYETHVYTPKAH